MKRYLTVAALGLFLSLGTVGVANAEPLHASSGSTVYVYTDSTNPRVIARLCREAQEEWGPADRCRVLPASYADVSVGEAADIADEGW